MRHKNILLVDFHSIIRDGLKAMLEQQKELQVFCRAANQDEILKSCQNNSIDLIILNADTTESACIDLTQRLVNRFPDIKVLALATIQRDQYIKKLVQAGASGYVLKDSNCDELFKAITTVLNDSLYFSEKVTQTVMQRFIKSDEIKTKKNNPFALTEREVEVLDHIVKEFTNQEIAEKLSISIRTVESHRRNLLQKTGSRNTAGLVRYAMENNIIR